MKKTIILILTRKEFDLETLPIGENTVIIRCGHATENLTISGLREHMERNVLPNLGASLTVQSTVYIVLEPIARQFAVAWMLTTALSMVMIDAEIWMLEGHGMYLGIKEFLATGRNWANELMESWKVTTETDQLKEVMRTEELDSSVIKKSE